MANIVCVDTEMDRLFGGFSAEMLHELWQLTIVIDKRDRRKISVNNYLRIIEQATPQLLALAWLIVYGTDADVINYVHGVIM